MAIDFTQLAARGVYASSALTDTTETALLDDQQTMTRRRGMNIMVGSDKDGTVKVYFIDRNNADWQIGSTAVTANILTVVDFDYHVARYKITFTRDDAVGTSATWVEAFPYGDG